jgi:hypothetical protein
MIATLKKTTTQSWHGQISNTKTWITRKHFSNPYESAETVTNLLGPSPSRLIITLELRPSMLKNQTIVTQTKAMPKSWHGYTKNTQT